MDIANDERFLIGVQLFNAGEYFDAHEVWEDLWRECDPQTAPFVKGLIQAAVALYHYHRGNWQGTRRLYLSAKDYTTAYPDDYAGVDIARFWQEMAMVCGVVVNEPLTLPTSATKKINPRIELSPGPSQWPDPELYFKNNHPNKGETEHGGPQRSE